MADIPQVVKDFIDKGDFYRFAEEIKKGMLPEPTDHERNKDTMLDEGGANQVLVADIKGAVTDMHTKDLDTKLKNGVVEVNSSDELVLNSIDTLKGFVETDVVKYTNIGKNSLGAFFRLFKTYAGWDHGGIELFADISENVSEASFKWFVYNATEGVDQALLMALYKDGRCSLPGSLVNGGFSVTVEELSGAVDNSHAPNTDRYLATQVANTLYVDSKRDDDYTPNGSITKPFLSIQDAIDAVTDSSAANKYLIEIAPGPYYSDAITINKAYVTFRSGGVQSGRISGKITVTNPIDPTPEQITFVGLRISGGLECLASHICINVIDSNVTGSAWVFNPSTPTDDEYLQVWGGIWYADVTLTNVYAYLMGGGYYSTFAATNKEFNINNADINTPFQVTLSGTVVASAYGNRAGSSAFILNTGSTLYMDADTEGGSVLTMSGGTLVRTTKASNIDNDSYIAGTTVKDALETLQSTMGTVKKVPYTLGRPRVLDLSLTDADLLGFRGGFTDGNYGYFVPYIHSKLAKVNLHDFSTVTFLDLSLTDVQLTGFYGGCTDGRYAYLAPSSNYKVARVDLQDFATVSLIDLSLVEAGLTEFSGCETYGNYVYLISDNASGKIVRIAIDNFAVGGVTVLDLTTVDASLTKFNGGFICGGYLYLSPSKFWSTPFGKVVRIDLSDFTATGVSVLDLATVDADLVGFGSAFCDGKYGYFCPRTNTKMARIDLSNFAVGGVTALDLGTGHNGYLGGFTDCRYGYCTPFANGIDVVRIDLNDFTTIDSINIQAIDGDLSSWIGSFTDGRHGYLVPYTFSKVAKFQMMFCGGL